MSTKAGLLGLVGMALFIGISFVLQMTNGPSRTLSTHLQGYDQVQVHLQTEPDPPKTGDIPLIIHVTDANAKSIPIDRIEYEYWTTNQAAQTVNGTPSGTGQFRTVAVLPSTGEWNVRVILYRGSERTDVKFKLQVNPNI